MKLLFHTHSVMSFILALTALGMFVHLVRLQEPVKAKKWLVGFFLGILLWQLENVVRYSAPLDYFNSIGYIIETVLIWAPALALTHISHTQFAYHFLITAYERERKIVLWLTIGLWLAEWLFVAWNAFFNNSNLKAMLFSFFCCSLLVNIWINIVALRKYVYLRSVNERASRAHLFYAVINTSYILASFTSLVFDFFSPIRFWSFFLFAWFGILASIVLYIVHEAVPANFQTKITGFTFVLAATVLAVFTLTFFPPVPPDDISARLAQQEGLTKLMIMTAAISVVIILVMPFLLRISLTMPLQRLLTGVQQVNAGNLDTQVSVGLKDEIGLLTQNFNQMTLNLNKAQDELKEYAQTLEKKVEKRTAQLQHSLNELKATQAQLIQSEKMASLGELTAGIAHEIKNPLNFIKNFSEVSAEELDEMEKAAENGQIDDVKMIAADIRQSLQKVMQHSKRADAIVKSMLQHSRAIADEKQLTDINELTDKYLRLGYQEMRVKHKNFNAVLETHFDTRIELLNVVPEQIGRALLNLLNNAFYSVHEKNRMAQKGYQPTVAVSTENREDHMAIIIRDNGTGIPQKALDKIFQPFFTTKPAGEGTGLGLSLSYDIITKAYGGEMKVETKEGEGASFTILLPKTLLS
ncbi:MAG: HAMP domain-containing protein [Flavisolibacter sp.]|nr:HAMP domain-containing protein [Flavisolibacter sp.]